MSLFLSPLSSPTRNMQFEQQRNDRNKLTDVQTNNQTNTPHISCCPPPPPSKKPNATEKNVCSGKNLPSPPPLSHYEKKIHQNPPSRFPHTPPPTPSLPPSLPTLPSPAIASTASELENKRVFYPTSPPLWFSTFPPPPSFHPPLRIPLFFIPQTPPFHPQYAKIMNKNTHPSPPTYHSRHQCPPCPTPPASHLFAREKITNPPPS